MKLMITAAVAVLALAISGCSATNSLSPQPGIADASVEPSPSPNAECHIGPGRIDYTRFIGGGYRTVKIHILAPKGYVAITADVYNFMDVALGFRGNDAHHGWYVPAEQYGGGEGRNATFGKNVTVVTLTPLGYPLGGYVAANIKWCRK
jgi:hypothetical protein